MDTYDNVFSEAQNLPPLDRIRLIKALWETVPVEDWPHPSQDWLNEAQHRSAEFDADHMSASPWSDVRKRALTRADLVD